MWNKERIQTALYWVAITIGVLALLFFARPADAEWERLGGFEYEETDVWNSGAIDARIGITPSGEVSDQYMIDYMDARDEMIRDELREDLGTEE